jgi:hypothetical protein
MVMGHTNFHFTITQIKAFYSQSLFLLFRGEFFLPFIAGKGHFHASSFQILLDNSDADVNKDVVGERSDTSHKPYLRFGLFSTNSYLLHTTTTLPYPFLGHLMSLTSLCFILLSSLFLGTCLSRATSSQLLVK